MALNSFTPGTQIESDAVNANWDNFSNHGRNVALVWGFKGTVTLNQYAKIYFSLPDDATWERADVICDTAPTGADLIVDIERSTDEGATWITIFTTQANRPTVSAGSRTGNTTTIEEDGATANTHFFRAKIEQIGSTVPGADVTVSLKGKYNLD